MPLRLPRRRFLLLTGGALTGLWIAPHQLIELPRGLVLKFGGLCSFCGKRADEVVGVAGVAENDTRIFDECPGLCLDIINEELGEAPSKNQGPALRSNSFADLIREDACDFGLSAERAEEMVQEYLVLPRPRTPEQPAAKHGNLACSFCARGQREVRKLIAGPNVYICDSCAAGGAALFMSEPWRLGRV